MPNPRGNLAGWSDREKPGWEDEAIKRVKARRNRSSRAQERPSSQTLFYEDQLRVWMDECAARRNISLSGYARRAICAMIAHDLGLPFDQVTRFVAQPANYGNIGGPGHPHMTHDDGKGHGPWAITGLKETDE
jgi:hypothetical protein